MSAPPAGPRAQDSIAQSTDRHTFAPHPNLRRPRFAKSNQTIKRLLPLLPLALVLLLAGCASDTERSAGIVHRLLLAGGVEDPGRLESFVGKLPEGLPVQPPLYPGAELVVSSRQPAPSAAAATPAAASTPEPVLYFIVLDTDDDRGKVFAYYEAALNRDRWRLESSFSSESLDTLQFTDSEDSDISGAVSIAHGGEDGRTSILISLQDAGAFREQQPPFEPGESLTPPAGFPQDVPLYEGAVVTDTAFFRESDSDSFLLVYLTEASQEDVISFYKDAFRALSWTVTDAPAVSLEDRIEFQDKFADVQGEIVADRFAEDRSFTQVQVEVRANAAPEPSATPTADGG